jgi:hypothetical protein
VLITAVSIRPSLTVTSSMVTSVSPTLPVCARSKQGINKRYTNKILFISAVLLYLVFHLAHRADGGKNKPI